MSDDKRKTEPPFGLAIGFGEALRRLAKTDPKEVAESIERSKQKRPPGNEPPRRSGRKHDVSSSPAGGQRKPEGD